LSDRDLRKNGEGYSDPTAYEAIKNVSKDSNKDDEKFHKLLHTIFYLCDLAGFQIQGRIVLVDKENGRVWR
jgi:hypothetical protein